MKKILSAHYEKIILAVLLIVFTALLYYQLMFIQRAQTQEVILKVNPYDFITRGHDTFDLLVIKFENTFNDGLLFLFDCTIFSSFLNH